MVDQPVLEDWLRRAGPAHSDCSGAHVREAELGGAEGGRKRVPSGCRLHPWRHGNEDAVAATLRTRKDELVLRLERLRSAILPHRKWTSRATARPSRGKSLTSSTFRSSGAEANCLSSAWSAFLIPVRQNLRLAPAGPAPSGGAASAPHLRPGSPPRQPSAGLLPPQRHPGTSRPSAGPGRSGRPRGRLPQAAGSPPGRAGGLGLEGDVWTAQRPDCPRRSEEEFPSKPALANHTGP